MATALCGPHLAKVALALGYKVEQLTTPIKPLERPKRTEKETTDEFIDRWHSYDEAVRKGAVTGGVRTHRIYLKSTGKGRKQEWKFLFHSAYDVKKGGMDPDCDCERCNVMVCTPKKVHPTT